MITTRTDSIPQELREYRQWLVWRLEERDTGKPTKLPCNARTGKKASATDPTTWATFDQAVRALESGRYDGLGFVFTKSDPFVGIDVDGCIEDRNLSPESRHIVNTISSYTELSPSGTGVHIIAKGTLPSGGNRRGRVEMYDRGRYFTITGYTSRNVPAVIQERQAEIEAIHAEYVAKPEPAPTPEASGPREPVNLADSDLINRAMNADNSANFRALWQGDMSAYDNDHSRADQALCNHLAFWTNGDAGRMDALFRQSGLMRPKWERADYSERTISRAIELTPIGYDPNYGRQLAPVAPEPAPIGSNGHGCPPDVLQRLEALETRLAIVETERDQAQARVRELEEQRTLAAQVVRNQKLQSYRVTAVAVVEEMDWQMSRGMADENGYVTVHLGDIKDPEHAWQERPNSTGLADRAGVGRSTMSKHINHRFAEWDMLEVKHDTRYVNVVDQRTGEILGKRPHTDLKIKLKRSPNETLRWLADFNPDTPKHGGARLYCKHHPNAKLIVTHTAHCEECGEVVDEWITRRSPDPTPENDPTPEQLENPHSDAGFLVETPETEQNTPSPNTVVNVLNGSRVENPRPHAGFHHETRVQNRCRDCGESCGGGERCSACAMQIVPIRGRHRHPVERTAAYADD